MKKRIILSVLLLIIPTMFIFANELTVIELKKSEKTVNTTDFKSTWTENTNSTFKLTENYSTSMSTKQKVFSAVGYVGLGNFVFINALYLFIGFIVTPVIGLAMDAEGDTWLPLLGLMGTSWIPFIGPFVGAAMMNTMAGIKSMVPDGFSKKPYSFYGPFIALFVLMGIAEIPFFIMMLVGFIGKSTVKNEKLSMLLESDKNGNKIIGLSYSF